MKRILLDIYNLAETGNVAATVTSKTGRYADATGSSVMEIHDDTEKVVSLQPRVGGGGSDGIGF